MVQRQKCWRNRVKLLNAWSWGYQKRAPITLFPQNRYIIGRSSASFPPFCVPHIYSGDSSHRPQGSSSSILNPWSHHWVHQQERQMQLCFSDCGQLSSRKWRGITTLFHVDCRIAVRCYYNNQYWPGLNLKPVIWVKAAISYCQSPEPPIPTGCGTDSLL